LVVAAVLTSVAVARAIGSPQALQETSASSTSPPAEYDARFGRRPDIYLVVLDAYSRSDHLREIYDFDNSEFERNLQDFGFQIPRRARANYTATFLALTAMLNWNYLDVVVPKLPRRSANRKDVYALLEDNLTARELQALGYKFVFFRSMFPPLSRNRLADRQIPDRLSGEFERYFLSLTVLTPIGFGVCSAVRCFEDAWSVSPEGSAATKEQFGAIARVASDSTPDFIFAHILLPHEPFRLDADCVPIQPVWPKDFEEEEERTIRRLYADQVECTNRLVLEMVRQILENSDVDPIILIQSDHGYGRLPRGEISEYGSTDSARIHERLSLFAAYRFPGDQPRLPWPTDR
ncbi:MAG: sulfatase-like hydrolase/transferase, partial [Gemmatimonadota bacterium]